MKYGTSHASGEAGTITIFNPKTGRVEDVVPIVKTDAEWQEQTDAFAVCDCAKAGYGVCIHRQVS